MITEDYVSFEIAKLLKEKGFDERLDRYYTPDGELILYRVNGHYAYCNNSEHYNISVVPTLQMAMKWLREMPKIAYNIFIFADGGDSGLLEYIYEIQEIDNELMHVNGSLDTNNSRYESYEEACEAAIKYCLENLI